MLYHLYQTQSDLLGPARMTARIAARMARGAIALGFDHLSLRTAAAALDVWEGSRLTHSRPAFGITHAKVGNQVADVREVAVDRTAFGTLLRFEKSSTIVQPRVLIVAPMSGHFATLLRGTVATMLPEHDVHITDWHNARDVPPRAGRFDFDTFIGTVIRFLESIGPGGHVLAVCQPAVAVLAAVAVMSADRHPATPRSMTLMAGPIDTRINPTKVNELAKSKPIGWFESNLIGRVPAGHAGAARRVYPGFVQLLAFMSMNRDRHARAFIDQFNHLVKGDGDSAAAHRRFYDEYLAVMDLPAEFYLQTVERVFQTHDLPRGELTWDGDRVDPTAIERTALFTVEGEQDDICAVGQTMAALDMCRGLRPAMKRHHLQTGAGHYGVFNGRRWAQEIYPKVREVIQFTSR